MKRLIVSPRFIAALFAGLLAPAVLTHAIPNSIGGVGFINPAGMRFEDFAAKPLSWKPNADLKAKWELWHDETNEDSSIEVLKLSLPALIFGINADEVTVYRRQATAEKFVAVFRPEKDEKLSRLEKTLRRNLAAWAESGSDDVFQNGATRIHVSSAANEEALIVTFTSLASSPAS